MKRTAVLVSFALAMAVGCVPTLNPVYTEKDLSFDAALVGHWTQKDAPATWTFTKSGEKGYELVYTDDQGRSGRFVARLANVGGVKLLDLYPVKEDVQANEFYKFHLMPIHTAYLVRQTSPHPQLAGFDLKWLDTYLTQHPDALANSMHNGQRLITASTDDVQAFLLEHQDQFEGSFDLVPVEE